MMLTVTGGQWFFPLVIICLILGIVATIAQKKHTNLVLDHESTDSRSGTFYFV